MSLQERIAYLETQLKEMGAELFSNDSERTSYLQYIRTKQKRVEALLMDLHRLLGYEVKEDSEGNLGPGASRWIETTQQTTKAVNDAVGSLRAQVVSLTESAEHEKRRRVSLEQEVAQLKLRAPSQGMSATSSVTPAPTTMTLPASSSPTSTVMANVKWCMRATKLEHQEIKIFCDMFEEYVNVQGLSDREAKFVLFQSLEGPVQKLACGLPKSLTTPEVIARLRERVKPSSANQWAALIKLRMKNAESIREYALRFRLAIDGLDEHWLNESQKFEIFIESLTRNWSVNARSLKRQLPGVSFEQFVTELGELEPGVELMDLDALRECRVNEQPPEKANASQQGRVVEDGRVVFENVTNVGRLMVACREIMRNSKQEAENMFKFLQRLRSEGKPSRGSHKRRGGARLATVKSCPEDDPDSSYPADEDYGEAVDDFSSEEEQPQSSLQVLRTGVIEPNECEVNVAGKRASVLNLPLVLQSHGGLCNRSVDALVDSGADRSWRSEAEP